ncbi:MAG: HDOD domain-containing protein [Bacillota bacterium]
MNQETILFVDDELQILRSLKRLFVNSQYQVLTAESGTQALEILRQNKIDLLVTDIKMPGMDGYQLLKKVKDNYPSTIRLVLSGNIDGPTLLKIQESCLVKLYLFKPWQNQELLRIIESIFSVEKKLKDKNLLEVINNIDFLPSPDDVYFKFNELIEQEADMKQISSVIESDPSITAKVLQVANSALYGLKTGSVRQALTYLGLFNVKNIVLSASLYKGLDGIRNPSLHKGFNTLWDHAVMTNKILAFLYQRLLNKKIPETSAMAGLLHDIGKVVLLSKYSEKYMKIEKARPANKPNGCLYEWIDNFEFSHSEIGGYLLYWWELPYSIVESALFNHNPMDKRVINKELVSLVHIADICSCHFICKGVSKEIHPEVLNLFNITKEEINNLVIEMGSMDK